MASPDLSGPSIDWPGLVEIIRDERRDAYVVLGQAVLEVMIAHPVVAGPFIVMLIILRRRQIARVLAGSAEPC